MPKKLIIITVGHLDNENIIKEICRLNAGKGKFLRVDGGEISKAFDEAGQMIISGQLSVETL